MTREISASKLCKARLCGKWVTPPAAGGRGDDRSRNTKEAILDGNLRHALMEFFITDYVKVRQRLSRSDFNEMMSEDNIGSLFDFLEREKHKYPSDLRIKSRRMASKLSGVVAQLGTMLSEKFGELISAEAELDIGGLDIKLSESFVLRRGEIDAVFVYSKAEQQRIIVVDWKRTIDETSREYYRGQLYTYARCLIEKPDLVGLPHIGQNDMRLLLVEVGRDDEIGSSMLRFNYRADVLDEILVETSRNLESSAPQVGNHCSSRCPHAFHHGAPCLAFDSAGEYEPNLTNEGFWNERKYADDAHFSMVQVKVADPVVLRRSKVNLVKFSANGVSKTMMLRNIEHEFQVEEGQDLRIEGFLERTSSNEVDIYCTSILRISQ